MRWLVLAYYVVLRSVLRGKPRVRRLLTRCRRCGIFFIADHRNPRRKDLGCPFGCAAADRCRRSNERSAAYNRSAVGKMKRCRREAERRLAEAPSSPDGSGPEMVRPAGILDAAHGATAPTTGSGPSGPAVEPPAAEFSWPAPDFTGGSEKMAAAGPAVETREDRGDRSSGEPGESAVGGSPPAEPQQQFAPGIVSYIRVVISLLEGRHVHRAEILEMLARTRRQRSFARERRVDYVLRRLREEPEKPP